jgi:hypothetical protein
MAAEHRQAKEGTMNIIKIFAGGKEVGMAKDATIHLTPSEEQEQTGWEPKEYTLSGSVTLTTENDASFRKFIEGLKFSREERRKMFQAVTHGGAIVLHNKSEELPPDIYINRPSVLRRLIEANRGFRFNYAIVKHFDPTDKVILSQFQE